MILLNQYRNYFLAAMLVLLAACSSTPETPASHKGIKDEAPFAKGLKDESSPRKRLMILPFLDEAVDRPQSIRDDARDEVIKELNRIGDIIVVDSKDLNLDFSKQISNSEYKMDQIAKASQELGISAVLEGKILDIKVKRSSDPVGIFRQMKTQFECVVRMRVFSSRSSKELLNNTKTVTLTEEGMRVAENLSTDRLLKTNPEILQNLVKESFLEFTPQILSTLERLSWEGRIALVNGDRIFLNVGRVSGLQRGDILKVSDEGDEVYDPQTGNYIGKVPGRLKGTLEVVEYFGQDGSIAVIHSGAGFKENDRVELY